MLFLVFVPRLVLYFSFSLFTNLSFVDNKIEIDLEALKKLIQKYAVLMVYCQFGP